MARCPMATKKRPPVAIATEGLMHHWRTVGPDIPCPVASPQSLTPFLRAVSGYRQSTVSSKFHWTPELCLENPNHPVRRSSRTQDPDEPEREIQNGGRVNAIASFLDSSLPGFLIPPNSFEFARPPTVDGHFGRFQFAKLANFPGTICRQVRHSSKGCRW